MFDNDHSCGVETTGPLPLFLHAALRHPEWAVRERLWNKLNSWLDTYGPRHNPEEVESVIRNFRGTPLEPFCLDQANLRAAVFLARLAFTRKEGQTRIRINSLDNPLSRGGMVLTHNLKTYFIERLVSGKYTRSPKTHWVFNPGREPEEAKYPPSLPARGWIGDHGYEASIDVGDLDAAGWDCKNISIPDLLNHSHLVGSNHSLIHLGIDAWTVGSRLHIAVARPELMIRLGPQIASPEGIWIILDQHPEYLESAKISLHLGISEETPKPLTAQVVLGLTDLGGWIHTSCGFAPKVEPDLLEVLNQWGPSSIHGQKPQELKKAA